MASNQTFTLNIKALFDASDVKNKVGDIQNALKNIKLPDTLKRSLDTSFVGVNKALDDFNSKISKGVKTKTDATGITRSFDNVTKELDNLDKLLLKVKGELGDGVDLSQIIRIDGETKTKVEQLKNEIGELQKKISAITTEKLDDLKEKLDKITSPAASKHASEAFKLFEEGDVQGAINLLDQVIAKQEQIKKATEAKGNNTSNIQNNIEQLTALRDIMTNTLSEVQQYNDEIGQKGAQAAELLNNAQQQAAQSARDMADGLHKTALGAKEVSGKIEELTTDQANFNKEIDQLKSRIQYFFGLQNAINLVKRAIRGAFDTIKELDKAMTATAVVTDFDVSDMWEQLPEYTKRANELGVTTLAAYEAATLYYQQGLKTNEVNALSVETLKMARIAGLDAAEATDRMTNALRGFNMALTEANAQRVDDVYSELAANTASNVDEISTAMTKVASLAHNANMEFETTAAFLSQIIETTRESAETAGTALKTVVARFSEVKKLVDEGSLRGTDEEGSIIDVNRVGQALRAAGIDLNKYFMGEVGLDDIFMELASKWDTLTSMQQRYIATQAAGSRQQSRFIALMSDYARTQELVGKAYNANGASARQFAKTQESLESKLNRLKNAWNEFLMGLTNNEMVKGFVDVLTNLLNFLNKITTGFDSTTNSVLKFTAALAGFAGLKFLTKSGGPLDTLLSTLLQGTTIGNGLFKGGILSGKIMGGGAAVGSVAAQEAAAAAAGQTVPKGGLGTVIGAAGKGIWTGAKKLGTRATFLPGVMGKAAGGMASGLEGLGLEAGTAAGLTGVATALGAVAVAVGLVVAGYQAWLRLTPEGQLKQAKAIAEAMNTTAANTQKAAEEMRNASESYKEYNDAVKNARTVEDRNEAIQNRNEYINSLLEQNESLAQYVSTSQENGQFVLTINEEQLAAAVKTASEGAAEAAISANFANALQAGKQADVFDARLQRAGVDLENRTIRQNMGDGTFVDRQLTNAEYAKYEQYAQAAANARAEQQSFARQAYQQDLAGTGLEDELSTLLAGALADTFDEDQYLKDINTQRRDNWWRNTLTGEGTGATRKELEAEYYRLFGTQADATLKRSELSRIVAQGQVDERRSQANQDVANLVASNESLYKTILAAYSGQGQLATQNLLGLDINNEADLAALLGLDNLTDGFNELEKAMGYTEDEYGVLLKQIKKQAAEQKKYQEQVTKNATLQMIQNGGYTPQQMASYLSLESFEDQAYIDNLLTQLQDSSFGNEVVNSVLAAMSEGNWQDSALQDWINSIDFSNPITGFAEIERAAKSLDPSIQSLATSIQQDSNYFNEFSNAAQVSYFLLSDSYNDLTEQLQGFIKENGSISSTNIKELAASNKELNTLLQNGAVSAKGLATVLNGIESNVITVMDLNNAVLAAISSMDDLDGIVKDVIEDLNNFDPGYDENDVTGFITKVLENATANIEKGAWGNNVMANYMQKIFGEFEYNGPPEGYGKAYKEWLQRGVAWLEANKDNMFSAWNDFAGENNKQILKSGEKTAEILEQNGKIIIHANGMTTEQLIQAMVETDKVTEQQARMMIADFKNYSADFRHEMAQNDLPSAIQAWYDALPEVNGKKIYNETDLETIRKLFGVAEEDITAAIKGLKQDAGELTSIDWTGGTGKNSPEAYIKQLEQLGFELKSNFGTGDLWDVPEFDYNKIFNAASAAGIQDQFESIFNGIVKEGKSFTATINGELTSIEVKAGETATEAYKRVSQELANKQLAGEIGNSIAKALSELGNIEINFIPHTEEAEEAIKDVNQDLNDTDKKIVKPTISVTDNASKTIASVSESLTNLDGKRATAYLDIIQSLYTEPAASGGVVRSYARGSAKNSLSPGFALTGEEGPEIIWNKNAGYAYVTGKNGAEFQNLQPGDRVFNAAETSRIFRNSSFARGGIFPSYATGYEDTKKSGKKHKGGSGSGSSSKDAEKQSTWRNELDWLYDLMEDIAEYERQQTIIQDRYDLYLKDITKTGRDLYNLTNKELSNLKTQLKGQQTVLTKRTQEMGELQTIINSKGFGRYLQYNQKDKTLEIDWDAIEKITDKEKYDELTDLISRAEDIQGKMDDAEKSIWDIKKQIQDLQNRYLQKYLDFQSRVQEAVVAKYQKQIDNLSELNDTLNDTNSKILDSIQKEIDLERQIRDNTNTENEIADLESRLAYLMRDTTGANAQEIRDIQKQIEEARENYSDTLVDQAVDRLSQMNEDSATQREQQVELMQAQLDYWQETGALWGEVAKLIETGFNANGSIIRGSELVRILRDKDEWKALSDAQKDNWANELILETNEVGAHILQLTQGVKASAETIRASISGLKGKLGGTPEHSYTAEKVEEKYATGGLNTYTGLAHLDGTPSEPEYVLNARQTDAFLRLADILPAALGMTATTSSYSGSAVFNVEVNVGSISDDYGVDSLVARIKEDLYDAASYRNSNVLGFLR